MTFTGEKLHEEGEVILLSSTKNVHIIRKANELPVSVENRFWAVTLSFLNGTSLTAMLNIVERRFKCPSPQNRRVRPESSYSLNIIHSHSVPSKLAVAVLFSRLCLYRS